MSPDLRSLAADYDAKYRRADHFRYRAWMFPAFVRALVARAGLKPGASVLDAGCGQGYFSALLAENGLKPIGVDISAQAVSSARERYGTAGLQFEVGNVACLPYLQAFDCVFVRGCSFYNVPELEEARATTEVLLGYLKPGGILLFDYYTNLCPRKTSMTWLYHSFSSVQRHFAAYPGARVYFSLRFDTLLLGRFAFSDWWSAVSRQVSHYAGLGGDIVSFVRKA